MSTGRRNLTLQEASQIADDTMNRIDAKLADERKRESDDSPTITAEDRAEVNDPPWCYDDSGQQFQYVSVDVARRILAVADQCKQRDMPSMRLWIIKRPKEVVGIDSSMSFVIRAETEAHARNIAATELQLENGYTLESYATCEPLEHDGEPGVILNYFYTG